MEIGFRFAKIVDIGYITILHFISGFAVACLLTNYEEKFDEKKESKKPIYKIVLQIIWYLWLSGVAIYIMKNMIEHIPSPLEGLFGLQHFRVKEVSEAPILAYVVFYFQKPLTSRLEYLYNYYTGY